MRIGRYDTERELGRGAMGVVFAARDPEGKPVAVKLLLPGTATREKRFVREIEALLRMRHENVVRLVDAGEHQGWQFLVTDLIDGETLEDRLARTGPLDPRVAARVARDVARGLQHAHANDVLHRDVKPANVLIDAAGRARLLDFGLTRDAAGPGSLTQSGQLLGTPGFWSPEQARGKRHLVGPATDVYGAGATLYAALTGEAPAKGGTMPEILVATCDRPTPPPSSVRPGVDRALEDLCLRCLEKDPADRFPSAAALADALDRWLEGGAAPGARPPLLLLAAAAGSVLLVTAGVAAVALGRDAAGVEAGARTEPRPAAARLDPAGSLPGPTASAAPPPLDPRAASIAQLVSEGWDHIAKRQERLARVAFDDALRLDPDHLPALLGRARARYHAKDSAGARADAERALQLAPRDPAAWVLKGDLHRGNEDEAPDEDTALACYEKALALDPRSGEAYAGRASIRHGQEDGLYGALEDYSRAIEYGAGGAGTYHNRAMVHGTLADRAVPGHADKAIADLTKAIELDPRFAPSLIERARLYRARGKREEAQADLERALELEETSDALTQIAWMRRREGDLVGARKDLERAVVADPRDMEAWLTLGEVKEELQDPLGAEQAFTRCIELYPDAVTPWLHRGALRREAGDLVNAREDLERAVVLAAQHGQPRARAFYERGRLYALLKEWRAAAEDFDRLAELEPGDPWAPFEKAKALVGAGDADAALVELERALQRVPRFGPAMMERGKIKLARGDRAGAVADWRQALSTMPPDSDERAETLELLRAAGEEP